MKTTTGWRDAVNPIGGERLHYLDWLRVVAILAIFVFHCTRLFDTDDWQIKNQTTYLFVDWWKSFATIWGMPLILLISGASAFYALEKTAPGKYLKGLLARLVVPLVVGIFTHVAGQMYLDRLSKGMFSGSFLEFYPHYFDGMYGFDGNFAWMGLHLWYLEILFILSLLFLPLLWWFKKRASGQRVLDALGAFLATPATLYLLALPAALMINSLDPATWGNRDMGGWSILIYPWFYLSGFLIISSRRLQACILRMRRVSFGLGLILAAVTLFLEYNPLGNTGFPLGETLYLPLMCLSAWSWLLAVIGFGMAHLNFSRPGLKAANEAVLPFYILHQTVIVYLAYFILQWAIPDWLKFLVILLTAFLICVGLIEYLIRRNNLLRFLFGMKTVSRRAVTPAIEPQLQEEAGTM